MVRPLVSELKASALSREPMSLRLFRLAAGADKERAPMKLSTIITIALVLATAPAIAEQQTRFYGPDGRSTGVAVPLGHGSTRYYDRRGNSLGTSTTTSSGVTWFYGPDGRPTGSTFGPARPRPIR
jgi:hypothetical protein